MTAAVVLAAGKGTRFKSGLAKVLHPAAGRTLLRWVLEALRPLALDRIVVVVGHQAEAVTAEAQAAGLPGLVTVLQAEQRGTGHAVRVAFDAGALPSEGTVLVLPGDVPLLEAAALRPLLDTDGAAATVLTARLADPTGYGRVLRDEVGRVAAIVEERDATPAQRAIAEVNSSIYAFDAAALRDALGSLTADNAQGEEYLTDAVGALAGAGVAALPAPGSVVAGVNDREQLAAAASVLRRRILSGLMRDGVTVVDPERTYVSAEARVAADAVLLPDTHVEGASDIAAGAVVGPGCRLVDASIAEGATVTYSVVLGARVGPGASVGPFSYLRPGTDLGPGAKAGAFVEMKNATLGDGAKVPHLSYMGDVTVGRGANVGAGTITCNYDGYAKHRTVIGDEAFVGSDTMLVAPVEVGAGAVTAAGSAITRDVPPGALAVERSDQRTVAGWAERRRERHRSTPT